MENPERRESCGCGCERPPPHVWFTKQRPPGLVFHPLDHQLISYLRQKLSGQPLRQPHPFMDLNVYKHSPQQLSELNRCGEREKEWYFFTTRDRKHKNGKRPNREAGGGFWKATGSAEEIFHDGHVIGWKRSLVYYIGKPQNGVKTNWIMHEFTAKDADYNNPNPRRTTGKNDMQLDGYVICKIHLNESKSESKGCKVEGGGPGQRKRKSVALTEDGCKPPQKDPGDRDFHAERSSPAPRQNDSGTLEPWGRAAITELQSVCSGIPMPEQRQQRPQPTEIGPNCFEHADTPDDLVFDAWLVDMVDFGVTEEQQRQTANHGAPDHSDPNGLVESVSRPPNTPFISQTADDQAVALNFNPTNNASDDSIGHGANDVGGLPLAQLDNSSFFAADIDDDLLDGNESSSWRNFDYNEIYLRLLSCSP